MRKGFTLIEILGVIILLGIIALITFAVITGLIKNTKEKAFEDSILNTEEAAYNFLASKVLYENATNDTCYIFNYGNDVSEITFIESKDGKDYYQAPISSMSVKNDNFTEGSITVCNNSIVSTLSNGEYTYKDKGIIDGGLAENDLTKPIINSVIYNNTSKSITVSVNANEEDYGKIKNYYYSLDGDNYIETSNNAYTFSSLKSDTEYTVYVKVSNESLMETLYNSKTTTVAISTPTYNVSPSGYATSKVLSIDYPVGYTKEYSLDGGTTWLVYSTALIFNNNGSVIARASDGTNYVTGSSYTVTKIDTTVPVITSFIRTGITSRLLVMRVTASDSISGIVKYEYKKDNEEWVEDSNQYFTFDELTSLQDYKFSVRVTNGAGLTAESSLVDHANACPVTTFEIDSTDYKSSKTLLITYPSGHSSCTIKEYSYDGTTWLSATGDGSKETSTQVLNLTNNATIYTRRRDGINVISGSYAVTNIDTTAPTASLATTTVTSKSVLLTATCADSQSGITKYEFSKDGGTTYTNNGTTSTYTYNNLTTGTYSFKGRCTNGSGLTAVGSASGTTNSITTPTYSISPSGYATSKTLTITYPSGYTKEYSLNSGTTWLTYTTALIFNANGSVIARVNDGTNYVTGSSYTISNIDTALPTVSSSISGATATISLGDNLLLSGYTVTNSATVPTTWTTISGNSISRDYTATSAGTYYAWVKDAAGNTKYSILIIPASAFAYNATLLTYGATSSNSSYDASCDRHCDCPHAQGSGAGHCNYDVSVGLSVSWWCSYSCPSGGYLSGSNCITTSYSCPSGGTLSGTTCSTYTCPRGGTLNGTTCVFN